MGEASSERPALGSPLDLRMAALDPPGGLEAGSLATFVGIGGRLRCRPEDFCVDEVPAYAADGEPGHMLVPMRKRGLNTEDALRIVAKQLRVPRVEVGVAGLKDRHALTRQWISVPASDPGPMHAALENFRHPAITLGAGQLHSHKLRRGHLKGNRFEIVVRALDCEPEQAVARVESMLAQLAQTGLRNYYGRQRFGHGGANIDRGLKALRGAGPRRGKADLTVSAGQSVLFNLYLASRARRGQLGVVGVGDVLAKRSTGAKFVSTDPGVDQVRMDAGELVGTGPMFGSKMRWSGEGPSLELELEVAAAARLTSARLAKLGRKVPGTRRALRVWPSDMKVEFAPACDPWPAGVTLCFGLPAGSYATVLLRELGVYAESSADSSAPLSMS